MLEFFFSMNIVPAVTTGHESSLVTIGIINLIPGHDARQEYIVGRYYKSKYAFWQIPSQRIFISDE